MMAHRVFWGLGAVTLTVALIAGATVALSGIGDFDPPSTLATDIGFANGDTELQGTYVTASDTGPIVLLVYGDGAQDRWSSGNTLPLVNALVDAGISVFSWDKPGIGASSGNWLHQTMQDRAAEVTAALAAVHALPGAQDRAVGLLGFSQAGWVLPRVQPMTDDADFVILVGPAINWQDQGRYFTTVQLSQGGMPAEQIQAKLDQQAEENERWFGVDASYRDYVSEKLAAGRPESDILPEDRFRFIRGNRIEDARDYIKALTLPVLVLIGANDLNVDPRETVSVYRALIGAAHPRNEIQMVPGATHSLLNARFFNYQLPDQWPLAAQLRFALAGRGAYREGVIQTLTEWIKNCVGSEP